MLLTIPPNQSVELTLVREFGVECGPFVLYTVNVAGKDRLLAATPSVAALLAAMPVDLKFTITSDDTPQREGEAINILRDCVKAAGGVAEPGVSLEFLAHLPGEVKALKERNDSLLAALDKCRELQHELALIVKEGN